MQSQDAPVRYGFLGIEGSISGLGPCFSNRLRKWTLLLRTDGKYDRQHSDGTERSLRGPDDMSYPVEAVEKFLFDADI